MWSYIIVSVKLFLEIAYFTFPRQVPYTLITNLMPRGGIEAPKFFLIRGYYKYYLDSNIYIEYAFWSQVFKVLLVVMLLLWAVLLIFLIASIFSKRIRICFCYLTCIVMLIEVIVLIVINDPVVMVVNIGMLIAVINQCVKLKTNF